MPYKYNPHLHVNIWLSGNPDLFLNVENQLRLIQKRVKNPKDIINFVYDSRLLTPASQKALQQFCEKHRIIPVDVRNLFPACTTVEERKLIALYEDEIQHLDAGGNLGAASDFLRWLKPIYTLGTYSDFDVRVDTTNFPDTIIVEEPLLLNMGSVVLAPDVETLGLNNHVIAVVDAEAAMAKIKELQQAIIFASEKTTDFLKAYGARKHAQISAFVGETAASIASWQDMNLRLLQFLDYNGHPMSSREMRDLVFNATTNNQEFSIFTLKTRHRHVPDTEEACQSQAAACLKMELILGFGATSLIDLATSNRDVFLHTLRENTFSNLLRPRVMLTSGPGALIFAFEHLFFRPETFNRLYLKFSLTHYGLEKAFISKNNVWLHEELTSWTAKLTPKKVGEICDASWLPGGQTALREREQTMEQSALTIQRFFRAHKKTSKTIDSHEKKTEASKTVDNHEKKTEASKTVDNHEKKTEAPARRPY